MKQPTTKNNIVDKQEWLEICKTYGKWCPFEDVKGIPYSVAVEYIKNLLTFSPQ